MQLGDLARDAEEYSLAQGLYSQAWTAFEQMGDLQQQAHSLKVLGDLFLWLYEKIQFDRDMYQSAITIYNHALVLYQAANDLQGEAQTLKAKGDLEMVMDTPPVTTESAKIYYQTALTLFTTVHDQRGEADTLTALSEILIWQKQSASDPLHRALALYEQFENQSGQARALEFLAKNAQAQRDYKLARIYFEQLIPLYKQLEQPQQEADTWISLGQIILYEKEREIAIEYFDRALAISILNQNEIGAQRALFALHRFARLSYEEIQERERKLKAMMTESGRELTS